MTSEPSRAQALEVLRRLVGRDDADFHDGQFEAISALVDDRRRALVVQRTGWGKSAVYFVATLLLRAQGAGPTILVSPLLALMRDQIAAAARAGVRAVSINSSNSHEWEDTTRSLADDSVDVLLVSPERLNNPAFRDGQLPGLVSRAGLLVVDEAHCISDWGHDFRPDYRRLRDLIAQLPPGVPVLATTATANSRVVTDVAEQLEHAALSPASGERRSPVVTIRGPLARASLRLGVLPLPTATARLAWLLSHLADLPGSGIIYALTVAAAEDTARTLRDAGHDVHAYTGRTDTGDRERLEQRLKDNEVKALVATSALGMGFDKPDLGFVLHLGAPSSPVAYYQQVGRAGRATENADVLLLPGVEDEAIWNYFATASMPNQNKAQAVIAALNDAAHSGSGAVSTPAIEAVVDIRRTPLELLLKVLDVDGAVSRVRGGWVATGRPWKYDAERYSRIAAARETEQQSMLAYERLGAGGCRMEFLQRALDDGSAAPCGRCDLCAGSWYPTDVQATAVDTATTALDRVGVVIEPRAQWPQGMAQFGVEARGNIPPAERVAPGRALARLSDLGWGGPLREIFSPPSPDAPAPDAMIAACIRVLADWSWDERPAAVVAMPSLKHSQLISSVASALATAGRLPNLGVLGTPRPRASSEPGGNSAYRLAAVWNHFSTDGMAVPQGRPVLLVDDLVDSRWTMTVAGRELRRAGASAVLPFSLALRA